MSNIAFNKKVKASSYVKPYIAKKVVNGSYKRYMRWLCNQVPGYLIIDLGETYWIHGWNVLHLGAVGWKEPDYNMVDYTLEISLDGVSWSMVDEVMDNRLSLTSRYFSPIQACKVRVSVQKGLRINPNEASCMEVEIYEAPPSSSFLESLTISEGTLEPSFESKNFIYTDVVEDYVERITVTPSSIDGGTIKVNGMDVISGEPSDEIRLKKGENPIAIEVTSKIGEVVSKYNLTVTRLPKPWLLAFDVTNSEGIHLLSESNFNPDNTEYTIYTDYDLASTPDVYKVSFTAFADSGAVIKICGDMVQNGQPTKEAALAIGDNKINVVVLTNGGSTSKQYNFNIVRASNNYLRKISIVGIGGTMKPKNFSKTNFQYTAKASNTSLKIIPTADAENANEQVEIMINDQQVNNGDTSIVDLSKIQGNVAEIDVKMTSKIGESIKTYVFEITKSS